MVASPQPSIQALALEVSRQIHEHGWAILCSLLEDKAVHVCTLGLEMSCGHADLEVLGLTDELGRRLMNELATRIQTGRKFQAGDFFSDLVSGYDLFLVDPPQDPEVPTGLGRLRLVWPDANHRCPWHDDCDPHCALQRLHSPRDGLDLESLYALLATEDQQRLQGGNGRSGKIFLPA